MTTTTDVYVILWNALRWPLLFLVAGLVVYLILRIDAIRADNREERARSARRRARAAEDVARFDAAATCPWPTRQTPLDHDRVNGMPFKIVPALTMADRHPLPEPDVAAHYDAPAPVLATVTVRNVTALPGYGSHDRAVAIGCDSQRGPDENTGALDPRAMRDLLAASRG